ncbi:MAG: sensor histidine kinase KdpD [Verrucomicrobia bacterium]|nr:sensor histidine kinase KdpD [Verrucomicrobiota bacterium]
MTDDRPDPDALLAQVQRAEAAGSRGRLKIFLGMAPGVGKTYAMLLAAQTAYENGRDVVAGVIETHGRVETAALTSGLPFIPRRRVVHRGATLEEFDLDATLARRPSLVLVDELAHTNAAGSRHPKRWQDVIELLDAGIDVWSTLNAQHLESRADAVREITGAPVHELVPDSVLDAADEVELIDISPEQLRERLDSGRVYGAERAAAAREHFFREGNLTGLRELTLRAMADRVQRDVREIMAAERIAAPWRTRERLLVAVGPAPSSERLIRYTRRLAGNLDAPWTALHVQGSSPLGERDLARLASHLELARRLGAEVVSTTGDDLAEAILRSAQQAGATQIVLGKPPGRGLAAWRGRALLDRLVRESGPIDVSVVRAESEEQQSVPAAPERRRVAWRDYALAGGILSATTLVALPLVPFTGYRASAIIYLLAITLTGLFVSRGAVVTASIAASQLWNFLFIPPLYTLSVAEVGDQMMLAMFVILGLVLGSLTARLRARERAERAREARTQALYQLTRALNAAPDLASALSAAAEQVGRLADGHVAFLTLGSDGELTTGTDAGVLSERERGVARWAHEHGRPAGRFTETLREASALYLPLRTNRGGVGVLALRPRPGVTVLRSERELLETCAAQVAVLVERDRLLQSARAAEFAEESGRLQRALFDSVSHELKTPLAVISAAAEQLEARPEAERRPLLTEVRAAARRLERTVDQLLDASRLESGQLEVKREFGDVRELLQTVAAAVHAQLPAQRVELEAPDDLPPCALDFGLIETALENLLFNAAAHSPPEAPITLSAELANGRLALAVRDRGQGLPESAAERERLFGSFQRGVGAPAGGLGLGLSIVRRLVEAHGGEVRASNAPAGGAVFVLSLPVEVGRLPP